MDWSGITIMPIQLQGTEYKTYIVVMLWNFETFYMYQPACCIHCLHFEVCSNESNFKKNVEDNKIFLLRHTVLS